MYQILFDFISKYVPLSAEEKQTLIDFDVFSKVKKGAILLYEGEKSKVGYFVLKGCLRTYYIIDGQERTTAFHTEMEGLTPNCVLTGKTSDYFVSATEDSIILSATPEMEEEFMTKFPKFEKFCRLLSAEMIAKKQTDLDQFKLLNPEERYQKLQEERPDLLQRVPQHQLASFLGVTPQSLSRLRTRIVQKSR